MASAQKPLQPAHALTFAQKNERLRSLIARHADSINAFRHHLDQLASKTEFDKAMEIFDSPCGDKIVPSGRSGSVKAGIGQRKGSPNPELLEAQEEAGRTERQLDASLEEMRKVLAQWKKLFSNPGTWEGARTKRFLANPRANLNFLANILEILKIHQKYCEGADEVYINEAILKARACKKLGRKWKEIEKRAKALSSKQPQEGEAQEEPLWLSFPGTPPNEEEKYEILLLQARESGRNIRELGRLFQDKP